MEYKIIAQTGDKLRLLPIEQLQSGRYQPRREFNAEQLGELAHSIHTQGIIQPIVVRLIENNCYEIIAGERRWRAAQLAGLTEVLSLIKKLTDEQAAILAIIENIQREDLNPIEEARSYQKFHDDFGYDDTVIAEKVGKSRSTITHTRRLLTLEPLIQDLLKNRSLQAGHGKVLASLSNVVQLQLAKQAANNNWSIRELEKAIKNLANSTESLPSKNANMAKLERALSDHIGCQVTIEDKEGRGHLKISYSNLEILEGVFQKIGFKFE